MEIKWNIVKETFTNDNSNKDINLNDANLKQFFMNSLCKHYPGQNTDFNKYRIAKSISEIKEKYKETVSVNDFSLFFKIFILL